MIIIQIVILVLLLVITYINRVITKQYYLFNWHNKNFFNIKKYLTKNELKYVYNILNHSPIEMLNKTMDGKRLSFITYSHELIDNNVKSGRFAIGSLLLPNLSYLYASDILKERNIIIPKYLLNKDYKFGGLGWDFKKHLFKIYFRCIDKKFIYNKDILEIINTIKDKNKNKILKDFNSKKYWKEGLISFTYKKNILFEKKIYLYPKYKKNYYETYMLSNKRGIIIQKDNFDNKINNKVTKMYENINFKLDTYSSKKKSLVMYFPR